MKNTSIIEFNEESLKVNSLDMLVLPEVKLTQSR